MDDRDGKSDLWNESADDIEEDSPDYETEYDRLVDTSTKIFVDGADDDKYDLVLGDAKEEKKEGEEDGIGDTTASVDRAGAESEADEVDLKAFPDPMLDTDGLAVVVGDAAEGSDVVGAIDIATSLTEDMAAVPGGVSGVTLPEDVGQLGDVSDLDNIPASVHRPPAWKQPRAWSIGVGGALLATIVIIYAFVNDETPTASNPPAAATTASDASDAATTGSDASDAATTGSDAADAATTGSDTADVAITGTDAGDAATTGSDTAGAASTGVTLPFDFECQLSTPDAGILPLDCPPELAVTMLTGNSPSAGVVAITIKTEAGLLVGDPNGSISLDFIDAADNLYECFVRVSGEAACRGFSGGFTEIPVPSGWSPPQWDPATDTFTQDGFAWNSGSGLLFWSGIPVSTVQLFLRSGVDPNETNTITVPTGAFGSVFDGSG